LQIDSAFEFTDRGTKVPLKAQLRCADDYTPSSFTISGSTARSSRIDIGITINGLSATVRDGKDSHEAEAPHIFFTVAGYAPAALQEAMMRYWQKHGKPARLATLPSGTVEITDHGTDIFTAGTNRFRLRRYTVQGLVWGVETLWMDDRNRLAAVITRDAEFDHFEAVRDDYEPLLGDFIAGAARDASATLEKVSKTMKGRQTGPLAITGATLIDGLGNPPISPATVITVGGKIAAAGPAASINIPADAKRVDATGKFIIPGLWDMHAHYEQAEWGPIYLAAGVTTVRDVGNELSFITATRDAIKTGNGLGPRLLLAGVVDGDGPLALGVQRVNSAADAAAWVKRYRDAGFQQIKIYSSLKPEMVKAVCESAHALGMTVTGHIPQGMSVRDGVSAGMDQVNHIAFVLDSLVSVDLRKATMAERIDAMRSVDVNSEASRQLIDFLKQHQTVIDDTGVLYELMTTAADEPAETKEPGIANVAPELQEQFRGMGSQGDALEYRKLMWTKALELIGALHKDGGPPGGRNGSGRSRLFCLPGNGDLCGSRFHASGGAAGSHQYSRARDGGRFRQRQRGGG
jgi:hypothetical protein